MFDDLLMLIDGDTDGSLTASATYDGVDVQESPAAGFTLCLVVPAFAGTTPTLDVVVEHSDTDSNANYSTLYTFAQIATTAPTQPIYAHVATPRRYIRANVTTGGTSEDFGAVSLGIAPVGQGRYWNDQ